jgi:hypothetical protein
MGVLSKLSLPGASTPKVTASCCATHHCGRARSSEGGAAIDTQASIRVEPFAAHAEAATTAHAANEHIRMVFGLDAALITIAVWGGYLARFQGAGSGTDIPYVLVVLGLITVWMVVLVRTGCYDDRFLGYGPDEYRRVVGASLKIAGAVAILGYLADVQVSRGFLGITFAAGCSCCRRGATSRGNDCADRRRERGWCGGCCRRAVAAPS